MFGETRKEYIRNFAAESFAFIMRKISDKDELYDFLLNRLKHHPEVKKKKKLKKKYRKCDLIEIL